MLELLLPHLKRDIDARIVELRPLVDEAERLEAAGGSRGGRTRGAPSQRSLPRVERLP
jgi:hypothetical protein